MSIGAHDFLLLIEKFEFLVKFHNSYRIPDQDYGSSDSFLTYPIRFSTLKNLLVTMQICATQEEQETNWYFEAHFAISYHIPQDYGSSISFEIETPSISIPDWNTIVILVLRLPTDAGA
jgi:hypothetical protein